MSLVKYDPFRGLENSLFSNYFSDVPSNIRSWAPAIDVKETEESFIIEADVPGIDPKEIDLSVKGNMLTISGKREECFEEKEENYSRTERSFGSFSRSFQLPETVDVSAIQAKGTHGVLAITIPKKEDVAPKRIDIQ